jgi:agmatine/peptidylarginine deiminase
MFKIFLVYLSFIYSNQLNELPQGLTDWELNNIDIIHSMGSRTLPPEGPIRNIAEYDTMQGVLIRYPFGISTSIIKEIAEDLVVYCLVSSNQQSSAYNSMNNADVNMSNVEFIIGSTDSYWTRDYGPWWITDGNGEFGIVDFTYNRPRPNDNQAPSKVAQHLDVPYYSADFVSTGGNYMTDGFGTSASSHIAYTENNECNTNDEFSVPLASCSYVDNTIQDYYGISTYHVVADPNNEYIDHIDCWGKFLSYNKILLREVPFSHPQYNIIEEVANYFASILTHEGLPWEIFRVYTPNNQPYTNSLILNNKVFVPIMNSSYDGQALEVYETALPNHIILPFTGSWEPTDALHCRVRGIPDLSIMQFSDGDINMDQNINVLDIVVVVNYVLDIEELLLSQIQIADLNNDNIVNILDIILIVNLILGN